MNSLHILHLNINGLRGKKALLELYVTETAPDVICLNETKLGALAPSQPLCYNIACNRERTANNGGGVVIYTRTNLLHEDISRDKGDLVATVLNLSGDKLTIIAYYCPPEKDTLDTDDLNYYFSNYRNTVITGDLNSKHVYFGSSKTDNKI